MRRMTSNLVRQVATTSSASSPETQTAMASTSTSTLIAGSSKSSTGNLAPIFAVRSSSTSSSSKRARAVDPQDTALAGERVKMSRVSPVEDPSSATPVAKLRFSWLPTNPSSLLHGTWGTPVLSSKLACFDVDGTLIETKSGGTFPKHAYDWKFWCPRDTVQARLKEYHNAGYSIVFISNQRYAPTSKPHLNFKSKMPLVGKALVDIPFRVLAATAYDKYRKPSTGMYDLVEQLHLQHGITIDKSASFYVGDAAGRSVNCPGKRDVSKDHADTDKGFAQNVGIEFYTPEEFFWDQKDLVKQPRLVQLAGENMQADLNPAGPVI